MTTSHRLEIPNERSMHNIPVPVGAGIAMVATTLVLWPWWHDPAAKVDVTLLAGLAGIGALSWIDDRYQLSAAIRLIAQTLVVALCLPSLSVGCPCLPFFPIILERFLLGLAWLWFINLFNFMDGIDGLAGSEAVAVALGYLALFAHAGLEDPYWRLALVIAAATGGYLFWNWHPARVFMGDSGSIPLGFLLGWLMLRTGSGRAFGRRFDPAALLRCRCHLHAFREHCFDGEKPWQAHRQHFYQRAVLGGRHALDRRVARCNCATRCSSPWHSVPFAIRCWRSPPREWSWSGCCSIWRAWHAAGES